MGLSILQLTLVSLVVGAQLPTSTVSQEFKVRPVQVSQGFRQKIVGRPTTIVNQEFSERPTPVVNIVNIQGPCPHPNNGVWIPNNGQCFSFSSDLSTTTVKANWAQAKEQCKALGAQFNVIAGLAEFGPDFANEDWLLEKITAKGFRVWLGAMVRNSNWFWAHSNRQLSTENPAWAPDEPNTVDGVYNCLDTIGRGSRNPTRMYLYAQKCSAIEHYVCQIY